MTKIQKRFTLREPLDEKAMSRIAGAHSIYGILRMSVEPSLDAITVEYDATRLRAADVEAALARAGVAIK